MEEKVKCEDCQKYVDLDTTIIDPEGDWMCINCQQAFTKELEVKYETVTGE